jgi:hypothetical protein
LGLIDPAGNGTRCNAQYSCDSATCFANALSSLLFGVDIVEKVLERAGTTESTALSLKREDGDKIRVTSFLWEAPKVILRGEVPEVGNVDCHLPIARKQRRPGEWDLTDGSYDLYVPGDEFIGD